MIAGYKAFSIHAAAAQWPDKIAIVQGDRFWTFAQVSTEVCKLQQLLSQNKIKETEVVCFGFTALLNVKTVLLIFALLESRIPFFPLHPKLPEMEKEKVLADLGFIAAEKKLEGFGTYWTLRKNENTELLPEDCLCIVQTSGSSGKPKGVALSRKAWLASCLVSEKNLGWDDGDRWLLSIPLCHVGGLSIVLRCLHARKSIVLSDRPSPSFDSHKWIETIQKQRVTLVSLVPTMLQSIVDSLGEDQLGSVRAILLGGACCSQTLLERAHQSGLPILTTYGMTETCAQLVTRLYEDRFDESSGVGVPLEGVEIQIIQEEVCVRSPTLLDGYFTRDGFYNPRDEEGWFRTGDFGYLDDCGNLHIKGRGDRRIISGGENVDPQEVEAVLLQFPHIKNAVVLGVDDAHWGQKIVAVVVFDKVAQFKNWADDQESILKFCKESLASFKCPKEIFLMKSIPLMNSGKVDFRRLREQI